MSKGRMAYVVGVRRQDEAAAMYTSAFTSGLPDAALVMMAPP